MRTATAERTTHLVGLAVSHFNKIGSQLKEAARLYPPDAIVLEGRPLDVHGLTQKPDYPRPEYVLRRESAPRVLEKWDSEEETMLRFEVQDLKLFYEDLSLYGGYNLENNEAYQLAFRSRVPVYHPETLWYKKDSEGRYLDLGIPKLWMDRLTIYPYGMRPGPMEEYPPLNQEGLSLKVRNENVGRFIDHLSTMEGLSTILLIMGTRHFDYYYGYATGRGQATFADQQGWNIQDFTAVDRVTVIDTNQPDFTAHPIRGNH